MKLALKKLLQAHPSIQVSTLLSGTLTTPSAKGVFENIQGFNTIASSEPTSGVSVTFSSIPSGFQHLQLRLALKYATTGNGTYMTFNSDTGNNYDGSVICSRTTINSRQNSVAQPAIVVGGLISGNTGNGQLHCTIIDIVDYKSATKYKTSRHFYGNHNYSTGEVELGSSVWKNTAAVSSITITVDGGFTTGSMLALYGIAA